jgi:hypothetical protein
MVQMLTRVGLTLTALASVVFATTTYYGQAVEWLARLEKLAHAAVPTVLAVALLYRVLKIVRDDQR